MSARLLFPMLLALVWAPAGRAQFSLFSVNGTAERPVAAVFDLGGAGPSEAVAARFRIRNISTAAATLSGLSVSGTGFRLASGPTLPVVLPVQATVDLTVEFRAADLGAYSASLMSDGISVLLTAAVLPLLTYQDGARVLAGPVDFGSAERGTSVVRRITIANQTPLQLTGPVTTVSGVDFKLLGNGPGGIEIPAQQTIAFDIEFRPTAAGARAGSLTIADRTFTLTGVGIDPALPKPRLAIDLAKSLSQQQGAISVTFEAAARIAGTGTATLDFRPASSPDVKDSAIAFASGGRTATFTFATGDAQARFSGQTVLAFQTGTSAGVLVVTVDVGGGTAQQTITIDPAAVTIASSQAARTAAGIGVTLVGFDNTRTLGVLTFTFFDAAGTAVPPGSLRVDASSDFARYFAASDLGGLFSLTATFPVTGDASKIVGAEMQMANSVGTAKTARIAF